MRNVIAVVWMAGGSLAFRRTKPKGIEDATKSDGGTLEGTTDIGKHR